MKLLLAIIILASCGNNKPHEGFTEKLDHLRKAQADRFDEALTYVDSNGWIVGRDCDSFLYSSKFGVFYDGFDPYASEYPDEPGRFNRRPTPMCREGNEDSRSTWSRDMGLAGLLQYAWLRGDLEILESHMAYVRSNGWFSGDPRSYDTTFYTPALRGLFYQVIYKLGGDDNDWRHVPNVYVSGLDDYRAHLQMVSIFIAGETWGFIDNIMQARVREHTDREPRNAFYQVMRGRWLGDWEPAIELCKYPDRDRAEYVRCDNPRACYLAEAVWSCGLLLRYISRAL